MSVTPDNPGAKTVHFHEHATPGPSGQVATAATSAYARAERPWA